MNKYQEALNNIRFYCGHANRDEYLNPKVFEELNIIQKLIDKHEQLELENFDLRQKLNAEGECCVMLQNRVKKLNNLIKILEEKFFIDIIEREHDYKVGFEPKIPIVENTKIVKIGLIPRFAQINNDEAKLLKEFLIDERYA